MLAGPLHNLVSQYNLCPRFSSALLRARKRTNTGLNGAGSPSCTSIPGSSTNKSLSTREVQRNVQYFLVSVFISHRRAHFTEYSSVVGLCSYVRSSSRCFVNKKTVYTTLTSPCRMHRRQPSTPPAAAMRGPRPCHPGLPAPLRRRRKSH